MITFRTRLMVAATGFFLPFFFSSCENKAAKAAKEAELEALRIENAELNMELTKLKSESAEKKKLLTMGALSGKIGQLERELAIVTTYNDHLKKTAAEYDAAIAMWKEPIRHAAEGMTLDSLQIKGGKVVSNVTVKEIKDGVITFASAGLEQKEKLENLEAATLIQLMDEKTIMDQVTTY